MAPNANTKLVDPALKAGTDFVEGQDDSELGAGRLNVNDALDES